MASKPFSAVGAAVALAVAFVVAACSDSSPPAKQAPPPPAVTAVKVQAHPVDLTYRYAGRLAAFREVEIRARVPGILLEQAYVEGSVVKAGDVMFRIDPATYEAELSRTKAQLLEAKAQVFRTQRDAERAKELLDRKVGTEKQRDDTVSAYELAKAAVAAAEAQVKTAEINLSYTTVRAPIDGLTSSRVLAEGSLVGSTNDNSLLARVVQLDPVYVYFSFTDSDEAEFRRLQDKGKAKLPADGKLRASLSFGDGTAYPEVGYIDFTDAGVNLQTGTIRARAVIANKDRRLRPGQFVRVTVSGITLNEAIVIPQVAVMQGPQGTFVYTVDAEDKAQARPVTLGREVGDSWVVNTGLASGDRVIIGGMIKVQPGAKVTVEVAKPEKASGTSQ